jgi:hypothetical protein
MVGIVGSSILGIMPASRYSKRSAGAIRQHNLVRGKLRGSPENGASMPIPRGALLE